MNNIRLALPVSASIRDLLELENRIRTSDPHTNVLQAMPPALRDRIILQLEFMGLRIGQIQTAFRAVNPNSDLRQKEKERNRRAWEYMLAVAQRYITTFSETAFVVAAAQVSVDRAITHLNTHIRRIERIGPASRLAKKTLHDIKARKADLENFRDVTLKKHARTLETDPAPKESVLENIQEEVERKISAEPFAMRAFGQLRRYAPAIIRNFIDNNTTRKIFSAVSQKLSHAESELPEEPETHFAETEQPEKEPDKNTRKDETPHMAEEDLQIPLPRTGRKRKSRRRTIFKGVVAGIASTVYMACSQTANDSLRNRWEAEAEAQQHRMKETQPQSYAQSADFPYNSQNPYARYARTGAYASVPHPDEAFRPVTVESGDYDYGVHAGFAESYAYAAGDGDDGGDDQGDIEPPSREVA